jgi:hypothetical protein
MGLLRGLRQRLAGVQPVVGALERNLVLISIPEPVHDLDLLGQELDPLGVGWEREAERAVLPLEPARPDPELDATPGDVVRRHDGLRQERRMSERDRRDHRAEPDALRDGREGREGRPRVQRASFSRIVEREVVVRAEQTVEAVPLAGSGEVDPLVPADPLLALDHQEDVHVPPSGSSTPSIS